MTKVLPDKEPERQSSDEEQVGRLVAALCERLDEVLPRNQFEVAVEHRYAVRIRGVGAYRGNTVWLSPTAVWCSPLPVQERLQIFLEAVGRHVQRFVSRRHKRWPTMSAKPRVSICEDRILMWWGGVKEEDAVVALRPILRREIGV